MNAIKSLFSIMGFHPTSNLNFIKMGAPETSGGSSAGYFFDGQLGRSAKLSLAGKGDDPFVEKSIDNFLPPEEIKTEEATPKKTIESSKIVGDVNFDKYEYFTDEDFNYESDFDVV